VRSGNAPIYSTKSGNVIKETDCNGNSIKYDYDSLNRLTGLVNQKADETVISSYEKSGEQELQASLF
jgi:YD repeat-containing protein